MGLFSNPLALRLHNNVNLYTLDDISSDKSSQNLHGLIPDLSLTTRHSDHRSSAPGNYPGLCLIQASTDEGSWELYDAPDRLRAGLHCWSHEIERSIFKLIGQHEGLYQCSKSHPSTYLRCFASPCTFALRQRFQARRSQSKTCRGCRFFSATCLPSSNSPLIFQEAHSQITPDHPSRSCQLKSARSG